jgi:hypothetical protein
MLSLNTGFVRLAFPLNVIQSADDKAPLLVADAVGKLKVCVAAELDMLKSVPLVPVAKYCTCAVKPFKALNPELNVVTT